MASYLRFDGRSGQACRGLSGSGWTGTGSIVLTAFVRILRIPTYTAPILGVTDGSVGCYHQIWLRRDQSGSPTGSFACNGLRNVAGFNFETTLVDVDATTGGNPVRVGRVYKVQSVAAWDASGGGYRLSFAVDGTIIKRAAGGAASGLSTDGGGSSLIRICGEPLGASDRIASQPIRAAHVEVLQAKVEFDRTITFAGGDIQTVDADSEWDEDMSMDASASDGGLYLLNEGTGSPQDSSGNGRNLGAVGTEDWAGTSSEPSISGGTGTYSFQHIGGYDLRQSDAPAVMPLPVPGPDGPVGDVTSGELRLAPMATWWDDDCEQLTRWFPTTNMSVSTDQKYEGDSSIKSAGSGLVAHASSLPTFGAGASKIYFRGRMYDPGGTTSTRIARYRFLFSSTVTAFLGVAINVSSTEYVTRYDGAGTPNQASGVAFDPGQWVEFLLHLDNPGLGGGTPEARYYIGTPSTPTALVRSEVASAIFPTVIQFQQRGLEASDDHAFIGNVEVGALGLNAHAENIGLVEASGSVVLPLFQPTVDVESFDSVTVDLEAAGDTSLEIGGLTVTFEHSPDGGTSYGASMALNDSNLQGLTVTGDGFDVLRITATFTSSFDDMATAALRGITIGFTVGCTESEPGAAVFTESGVASSSVTESSPASQTMTESDPSADPFTESNPSSDTFTESNP